MDLRIRTLRFVALFFLAGTLFSCGQENKNSALLDANNFEKALNTTSDKQIIDVRTPEEFSAGFIRDAKLINFYDEDFSKQIEKLDKNKPVFVYCKGGGRSAKAAEVFRKAGFTNIFDLKGGFMSWENSGKPVEKSTSVSTTVAAITKLPYHIYNRKEYDSLIASGKPVLIDFYAKWCAPCKKMAPVLEKLRNENYGKVSIIKIDIDDAKELCKELKIEAIPVVKTFRNGKETESRNGEQSEAQLTEMVKALLK
jgi:thioredoxin 1